MPSNANSEDRYAASAETGKTLSQRPFRERSGASPRAGFIRLVPVLLEWEVLGGPPMNLIYKGSARRTPRLRVFIDYLLQCLRELNSPADIPSARAPTDRPAWHVRGYGRASATLRGRR